MRKRSKRFGNPGATAVFLAVPPTVGFLRRRKAKNLPYMLSSGPDPRVRTFWSLSKRIAVHIRYPAEQATNNETAMSQEIMEASAQIRRRCGLSQRRFVAFDAYLLAVTALDRAMQAVRDIGSAQNSRDRRGSREERKPGRSRVKPEIPSGTQIKDALNGIDSF